MVFRFGVKELLRRAKHAQKSKKQENERVFGNAVFSLLFMVTFPKK